MSCPAAIALVAIESALASELKASGKERKMLRGNWSRRIRSDKVPWGVLVQWSKAEERDWIIGRKKRDLISWSSEGLGANQRWRRRVPSLGNQKVWIWVMRSVSVELRGGELDIFVSGALVLGWWSKNVRV